MIGTEWKDIADLLSWYGNSSNIGPRIREIRENRRDENGRRAPWTQEQLADAMTAMVDEPGPFRSMDKHTIWKIENAERPSANRTVTVNELIGFAKVLNVTIADLLLPGDHAAQLVAFRAVTEAAERLQEVREAWHRYFHAVGTARARLAASDDARAETQAQFDQVRSDHVRSFRRANLRYSPGTSLEDFAAAQAPTPLLAALDDVLATVDLHRDAWHRGRHEPAVAEAAADDNGDAS